MKNFVISLFLMAFAGQLFAQSQISILNLDLVIKEVKVEKNDLFDLIEAQLDYIATHDPVFPHSEEIKRVKPILTKNPFLAEYVTMSSVPMSASFSLNGKNSENLISPVLKESALKNYVIKDFRAGCGQATLKVGVDSLVLFSLDVDLAADFGDEGVDYDICLKSAVRALRDDPKIKDFTFHFLAFADSKSGEAGEKDDTDEKASDDSSKNTGKTKQTNNESKETSQRR